MSNGPIYLFRRGAPIMLGLEVVLGDPDGIIVEADLKRTTGQVVPPANAPVVASFDVTFSAAVGDEPARWFLSIDAVTSSGLEPGHYATDARYMRDGQVLDISATAAFIRLSESVSG